MADADIPYMSVEGDDPGERIVFVLPAFVTAMGFACAREWTESSISFECGCPRCLKKIGLTLIFNWEDWNDSADMQDHWRKRIVSVKIAEYASHLICPGYV